MQRINYTVQKDVSINSCVCVLSCVWLFVPDWLSSTKLLYAQYFPGKNTGVGCHFLLQGIFPTPWKDNNEGNTGKINHIPKRKSNQKELNGKV